VILIFIEGVSVAAVAFMLTFFNAMVRELRHDRAPGIVERQKSGLELVTPQRHQHRNRAA